MKKLIVTAAIGALCVLNAPAFARYPSSSGSPEAEIDAPVNIIIDKATGLLADGGYSLVSENDHRALFRGNTNPMGVDYAEFTFIPESNSVCRVILKQFNGDVELTWKRHYEWSNMVLGVVKTNSEVESARLQKVK